MLALKITMNSKRRVLEIGAPDGDPIDEIPFHEMNDAAATVGDEFSDIAAYWNSHNDSVYIRAYNGNGQLVAEIWRTKPSVGNAG